jgi:hypothetical protein
MIVAEDQAGVKGLRGSLYGLTAHFQYTCVRDRNGPGVQLGQKGYRVS